MDYFNQETERLTFRKLGETDIESWKEFFVDNPNLPYMGIDLNKGVDNMARDWILKQLDRYQNQGLGHLAVIEKQSGDFIGMGGILPRDMETGTELEVAYSLKPPYWGKGYGTEIAIQLKNFGITHQLAYRFISIIHKDNIGSIKVAQKNGMKALYETEFQGMNVYVFGLKVESIRKKMPKL